MIHLKINARVCMHVRKHIFVAFAFRSGLGAPDCHFRLSDVGHCVVVVHLDRVEAVGGCSLLTWMELWI